MNFPPTDLEQKDGAPELYSRRQQIGLELEMQGRAPVTRELRSIAVTTLYFVIWLGVLICLKRLLLAQYEIRVVGLSVVLTCAVLTAKVTLMAKRFLLGPSPAALDFALRACVYSGVVVAALALEMAFEVRNQYTGFGPALARVFRHPDLHQVYANALWMAVALLGFEALSRLRRYLQRQPAPADHIQ
jgi:hypothetical protein